MTKRAILLIGTITVIILILLGVGAFALLANASASHNKATTTPTSTVTATPAPRNIYAQSLAQYGPAIRTQIAQGLHLTPEQVADQIRSGKTISQIATAQHLTSTQLQTLITNSFEQGLKPAVASGQLTQKQVDALAKRMVKNQQALDNFLKNVGKGKKKATPTASPTATQGA